MDEAFLYSCSSLVGGVLHSIAVIILFLSAPRPFGVLRGGISSLIGSLLLITYPRLKWWSRGIATIVGCKFFISR